ncbi:hypothetical protein NDA18_002742 [Ustilago nuda]|nr:hypothetical protein NDA18_002742 [Ustilago nuda]
MTDNTKMQAGASKAKGGRKGKAPQLKQYNFRTLVKLLEPVPKLTSQSYYSWNVHIKSFLQSVPHAMKHLEGTYNKKHPKWNPVFDDALTNAVRGTIDTTGEYNTNYLILDIIREHHMFHQIWKKIENALTIRQSAVKNCPAQKIDPRQASVRVAGSDDQEEPAAKDEKDKDNANTKVAARPRKIWCWVCKQPGHGINLCDTMVTIPENSALAKTK